jgi:hypothetical protein
MKKNHFSDAQIRPLLYKLNVNTLPNATTMTSFTCSKVELKNFTLPHPSYAQAMAYLKEHKSRTGFCVHHAEECRICFECQTQKWVWVLQGCKEGIISPDIIDVPWVDKNTPTVSNIAFLTDPKHKWKVFWNSVVQSCSRGYTCKNCGWEAIAEVVEHPLSDKEYWEGLTEEKIREMFPRLTTRALNGCSHRGRFEGKCEVHDSKRKCDCISMECQLKGVEYGSSKCLLCGIGKGKVPCCPHRIQMAFVDHMARYTLNVPNEVVMYMMKHPAIMSDFIKARDKSLVIMETVPIHLWGNHDMTFLRKEQWAGFMKCYLAQLKPSSLWEYTGIEAAKDPASSAASAAMLSLRPAVVRPTAVRVLLQGTVPMLNERAASKAAAKTRMQEAGEAWRSQVRRAQILTAVQGSAFSLTTRITTTTTTIRVVQESEPVMQPEPVVEVTETIEPPRDNYSERALPTTGTGDMPPLLLMLPQPAPVRSIDESLPTITGNTSDDDDTGLQIDEDTDDDKDTDKDGPLTRQVSEKTRDAMETLLIFASSPRRDPPIDDRKRPKHARAVAPPAAKKAKV